MAPRVPTQHPLSRARSAVIGNARRAGRRSTAADPIERSSRRDLPALLDADLDGLALLASPRRPIAARLVGILGPIGLTVFLAVGYACGLKLYTSVSLLEDRAIGVLGGFLAFFLIAVWPTFGDEGHA
jgi:hypothetical protein